MLTTLLSFLASWFGRVVSSRLVQLYFIKAILFSFAFLVLPPILYNVFVDIIETLYSASVSNLPSVNPVIVHLTGFVGFLANSLSIPQSFSVIISAAFYRVSIQFITKFI